MDRLTIERTFSSDPFPDGNVVVTLKTKERGDVKYTVYNGKQNPFQDYRQVNGRQIFCELTEKGYIKGGNFEWANGAQPQQSNQSNYQGENNSSVGSFHQNQSQNRGRGNVGDPRQQSIERQACMKTSAEIFDTCIANGALNPNMNSDEIADWVADMTDKLYNRCLG